MMVMPMMMDTMSFSLGNGFSDGTSNTFLFCTRYSQASTTTNICCDPTMMEGAFFGAHAPMTSARSSAADCAGGACTYQYAPTKSDADMNPSTYGHSYGASGLSVCMGDCVVRQVDPSVSVAAWNALVHPADGTIIIDSAWTIP